VTDLQELTGAAAAELAARADPAKAGPMQAYMKTDMPFHGVQSTARRQVGRMLKAAFPVGDNEDYRAQVAALWSMPHREEKYLAIDWAVGHRRFVTMDNLDLFRRLIVEGAWWDLVDPVATGLVGRLLLDHRPSMTATLYDWVDDPDLWIRRTALISQVGHKSKTDAAMLFDFCLRRAGEKEFFIRKAIGWALRDFSKTDPGAVGGFLAEHGHRLSGLSMREASKYV
jgi:3-methyladenine DNA glycosylase AlkD